MSDLSWLKDIIYLLPIAGLIWSASQEHAALKQLRKDVEANIAKFCAEHKELEQAVNHNKVIVDGVVSDINAKLTDIRLSIVKIEATLEKEEH